VLPAKPWENVREGMRAVTPESSEIRPQAAVAPPEAPKSDPLSPVWVLLLESVSLLYISAPFLIFCLYWLRPIYSIPLAIAYVATLAWGGRRAVLWSRENAADVPFWQSVTSGWRPFLGVVVLSFACVACTGVGGLTFRFADYVTYDSLLKLLMGGEWPVGAAIERSSGTSLMPGVYYWAYFLPSAFVGKLAGWNGAHLFQYFWSSLGVLLVLLWFLRILGVLQIRYALMFLFFAGLDVLGYIATSHLPDGDKLTWADYLTGTYWWSIGPGWMAHWTANWALLTPEGTAVSGGVFYRFYGPLSFLFDGVIHVLPSWLLLMTVLHDVLRRKTLERAFFLTSILPLCSVFVTMGAVPMLAMAAWHTRLKGLFTPGNVVVGPIIVLLFALFYQHEEQDIVGGWLWKFQDLGETGPMLLLYYVVSFGILAAVAPSMQGDGFRPGRVWFYGVLAVFLFAPWYRMGLFNDFTTKFVIPSQLVFMICLATALLRPEGAHAVLRKRLVVACLVVGAWSGIGIIHRAVQFGFGFNPPSFERTVHPTEEWGKQGDMHVQSFTQEEFFWKYLARPVEYQPTPPNPVIADIDFKSPRTLPEHFVFFGGEAVKNESGFVIKTKGNTPFLRKYDQYLYTDKIGSIDLVHSVVDAEGNTPDYRIVFQWADDAAVARHGDTWPFHRWYSPVLYPKNALVTANSYWRNSVVQFALSLEIDGPPDAEYTVTLERLNFMQR